MRVGLRGCGSAESNIYDNTTAQSRPLTSALDPGVTAIVIVIASPPPCGVWSQGPGLGGWMGGGQGHGNPYIHLYFYGNIPLLPPPQPPLTPTAGWV